MEGRRASTWHRQGRPLQGGTVKFTVKDEKRLVLARAGEERARQQAANTNAPSRKSPACSRNGQKEAGLPALGQPPLWATRLASMPPLLPRGAPTLLVRKREAGESFSRCQEGWKLPEQCLASGAHPGPSDKCLN